ncbi:MAG TPA: hypothetical protein ENH82_17340 [bacterium]|nr:hypothetical protein [bacterium]
MINLEAENTHILFDEKGYPVVKDDPESINDTCGRLVLMGMCYGFISEITLALERLLVGGILIRHPTKKVQTSRDHHSYFYIYRKYTGQELPNFPSMRGMNSWMKALTGNKRAEWWYYTLYIPGAIIGNVWLRLCRWVGRIREELPNEIWILPCGDSNTGTQMLHHRTRWEKLWGRIISITIPAYALHNKAWQIYVIPDSKRKEWLKRILLKRVGKSNIMLRLLFGDTTVTQQEVDNYPHMTGYRPGAYLNTTRRTIRELTDKEAEFNTYEKDLIIWLYEQNKNRMV